MTSFCPNCRNIDPGNYLVETRPCVVDGRPAQELVGYRCVDCGTLVPLDPLALAVEPGGITYVDRDSLLLRPGIVFAADRMQDPARAAWDLVVGEGDGRVSLKGLASWAEVEAAVRHHYGLEG